MTRAMKKTVAGEASAEVEGVPAAKPAGKAALKLASKTIRATRVAKAANGMPAKPATDSVPAAKTRDTRAPAAKKSRKAAGAARKSSAESIAETLAKPTAKPVAAGRRRAPAADTIVAVETAVPVQIGNLSPAVTRPSYWERACTDLMKRDRILKKLIPAFGPVHLVTRGDPFVTLARSIVGQQISVKAAQAVWERFVSLCPALLPAQIVKLKHEELASSGLSKRKAEYILDLGAHFVDGTLHVDRWSAMEDEAVISELTEIRGIGRWTAEMFLIFNLLRPNVLPLDDVGLIRAISVNYFSGEPVTRSEAREVAANWEPWRTVATWYMWRSLDPLPVEY